MRQALRLTKTRHRETYSFYKRIVAENDRKWTKQACFPAGPVVKTPRSYCKGCRFDPDQGSKIPHALQCDNSNKRNLAIFDDMKGPWVHYAKWNVWERQMLFDLTFLWNLKNKPKNNWVHRYREQTGRWLPEAEGERVKVVSGTNIQWQKKYILGMWYSA